MSNYRVRQAIRVSTGWPRNQQLLLIALVTFLNDDELTTDRATSALLVDECGFPRSSLRLARKGLVGREAIKYEPGIGRPRKDGQPGKARPSVYTFLCLPEKGQPKDCPLSTGQEKGQPRDGPLTGKKGSGRAKKRVSSDPLTSGNDSQLVPQLIPIPPTAARTPPETATAQTILATFIDWDRGNGGTLTKRTIGQLAKAVAGLLAEGIEDRHIRRGLAEWRARGQHPATLDSFVSAAMNGKGSGPVSRRQAERNARYERQMARARERDAAQAATPREITTGRET